MSRKEDIYELLASLGTDPINGGMTTGEISEELNLLRNNVSHELNTLVREGKIIKSDTRPVFYKVAGSTIIESSDDPFDILIGHDSTLKQQVSLAKSAMIYPPNGLHCLLIGPTGVGKTHFAKIMHRFASITKNKPDLPFVVFNCADYSNNPELLVCNCSARWY